MSIFIILHPGRPLRVIVLCRSVHLFFSSENSKPLQEITLNNSTISLVRQAAHVSDVGNMVRIIDAMFAQTCIDPHRCVDVDNFQHSLREVILNASHKKLVKLVSQELNQSPDDDRLRFLATQVGHMADRIQRVCNGKSRHIDGARWFEVEDLITQEVIRRLSDKFAQLHTFSEAMALWKATPRHRKTAYSYDRGLPRNYKVIGGFWIRILHRLIRLAETVDELKLVAAECPCVDDGIYIRSNVVAAKWLGLVNDFPGLLDFLNSDAFGTEMRSALVDEVISKAASLCLAHEDYVTVSKALGGGYTATAHARRWYELFGTRIIDVIKAKAATYSMSGREELSHIWWSLGLDLRKDFTRV